MTANGRSVRPRIFELLRPHLRGLVAAALLGIAGTAATLFQPYVIGRVVGRIVRHQPILSPFLLLVALFVSEGVLAAAQVYLLGRVGNSVVLTVRNTLVRRLLRAPIGILASRQRGDMFATAVADTSLVGSIMAQSLATLAVSSVMVLGSIGFMAYLDLLLTGTILAAVTVTSAATIIISGRLREATKRSRDRVGEFGSALQRALGAVKTVKISRAEDREEARIGGYARRSFAAAMQATRLNAVMISILGIGVQGAFAAVFTVGAFRLADGALTTGTYSAYLLYLLYLIAPLMNLLTGYAQFQQCAASAMRVTGLLDDLGTEREDPAVPVTVSLTAGPRPGRPGDGALLRFRDVSFSYNGGAPVLRDVTFEIPRHGLTAIVGPSGAGKSTVFALIERFYPAGSGSITLDGADIATMPLAELRGRIGYVEQETPVLDGTLRENLLYANPDATGGDLAEAIELAGLSGWVGRLPRGLDTQLGENGAAISGGERQRVTIARMLLAKPDLLLLDEITSQLDTEAEAALHQTMALISGRCAVVAIAHQLATAAMAGNVLLFDEGRLRAQGRHGDLLAADDLYRRLAATGQPSPVGAGRLS